MSDLTRYQDPLTVQRVLYNARTIAIVGLSPNELRASYFVGYYLKRHGYEVIPVNPREAEILGTKTYKSLLDVPVHVDIVNVFRAPDALLAIAEDAVKIRAGNQNISQQVMPTRGYLSSSELPLTIGLGKNAKIDDAQIIWPDGSRQTGVQLQINSLNTVSEP